MKERMSHSLEPEPEEGRSYKESLTEGVVF
jgi:hypothetical protein